MILILISESLIKLVHIIQMKTNAKKEKKKKWKIDSKV